MGANYYTAWIDDTTRFRASDMNAPLITVDRALTYFKGAFVGCDGVLSWSAGTLTWSDTIHIYFNRADGDACHNTIAAGSIALSDSEFAYVDLSETNDAAVTVAKAAFSPDNASNFITYNRLLLGYRNAADDGFYPEELSGIFAMKIAEGEFVEKATYNANTVLAATTDDTPAAVTIAEQQVLGRITGGNIKGLSAAELATLIGAVTATLFNAYSVLYADTDNTPAALTVAASTVVGRKSTGGIAALSMADLRTELANLDGREQEITCADTVTIDWSAGATARMLFDRDSVALTLSNGVNGKVYRLLAKQSAGGSDVFTWTTTVKWRGGSAPTLTTAGNAIDILTFVYINGAWYGDCALNFA
jgi:hypothetical protein